MDKWQPIETAPRDKIVIVSYRNGQGLPRTAFAELCRPLLAPEADPYDGCEETLEGDWLCPSGWYGVNHSDCAQCGDCWATLIEGEPTHWMPLPEPPEND